MKFFFQIYVLLYKQTLHKFYQTITICGRPAVEYVYFEQELHIQCVESIGEIQETLKINQSFQGTLVTSAYDM